MYTPYFFSIRQQKCMAFRPHIIFCNYFNTYVLLSFQACSIITISLNSIKLKFNYNCHECFVFKPRGMLFLGVGGWTQAQHFCRLQWTQRSALCYCRKQIYYLTCDSKLYSMACQVYLAVNFGTEFLRCLIECYLLKGCLIKCSLLIGTTQ